MRKLIFTLSVTILALSVTAQEKKENKWKLSGMFYLNVGQGGSRNWTPGAERFSFQAMGRFILDANYADGKHSLKNSVDLAYGMQNATTSGFRKAQDKIDVVSKYGYTLSKKISIGAWFNMRTQFSDGHDYSTEPKTRISGIMAPGYLTLAPGIYWTPGNNKDFSIFVAPTSARLTVVSNRPYSYNYQGGKNPDGSDERPLADKYGVDPERQVKFESGLMTSIDYKKKNLLKNVDLRTRMDIFSDYTGTSKEFTNFDIFWNNVVTMSVNKWLNVVYSFDMIYDGDQKQFGALKNKEAAQLHSMLGVGLAVKF